MEEIFNKVEKVLSNYPKEWSNNYYQNKQDVKIIKKDNILDVTIISGQYISDTNTIELVDEDAIYHELSHMAFNDRNKYHKKILENDKMYYDNGVMVYTIENDKSYLVQRGINEGFAEYLSRKNSNINGQEINYYFVNFLISIFGEDILKYPLTNDPIGLLSEQKFYSINKFINNLDQVNNCLNVIQVSYEIEKKEQKYKYNMQKIRKEYLEIYNSFIIETFDSLYNEYNKYSDRLINYEKFLILLNDFNNYDIFNSFENKKYNVKKYINSFK